MEVGALKAAMTASDSDMAFGTIRYASLDFNPIQIPNQNPTIGRCQLISDCCVEFFVYRNVNDSRVGVCMYAAGCRRKYKQKNYDKLANEANFYG
jgi:hypothetical protein